jgi:cytochrome P450
MTTLSSQLATRNDMYGEPPLIPGHWLWGSMPDIKRDALGFYTRAALDYGGVLRLRTGPYISYMINDPEHIKYVLQDNHRNYDKNTFTNLMIKPVVGEGLLTSEGELWLQQRRLMQPAFHRQRIAELATTMTNCTAAMLDRWQKRDGQSFDVVGEMMRLTLDIVSKTLFSRDIENEAPNIAHAVTLFVEHIGKRTQTLFSMPTYVPTSYNRRYKAAIRILDRIIYHLIQERREQGTEGTNSSDLLSLLLEARDEETQQGMSDKQLRDEVVTLYIAGHETTAIALSWALYLLSKHPEVERRLQQELRQVLGGRTPTIADLPNLPYNRMILDETLRLYPPAWAIARRPVQEDTIGGYTIRPNRFLFFSPYVMHRHPTHWDNPEGFDPERFAPNREAERPRYAYFPFGGGPRQCIGNIFSLTEAQLILTMIVQNYQLSLVPGHPVEPAPLVTLRPRYGIKMTLKATKS